MQDVSLSVFKQILLEARQEQGGIVGDIRLSPKEKWPLTRTENTQFYNVDLNSPIVGGILNRPSFRKCKFVNVDFDGINCTKALFHECDFEGCVFGKRFFGSISNTEFKICEINSCSFVSMEIFSSTFEDCVLSGSNLRDIKFRNCQLKNLSIEGELKRVSFLNCIAENVNLSSCMITDSRVLESRDQDIALPNRTDNFLATHDDFIRAGTILESMLSRDGFDAYRDLTRFAKLTPVGEIVDESFFEDLDSRDRVIALQVLFENRIGNV
jgi:hypothetical protein